MPIRRGDFSSHILVSLHEKRPRAICFVLDDCLSMVCSPVLPRFSPPGHPSGKRCCRRQTKPCKNIEARHGWSCEMDAPETLMQSEPIRTMWMEDWCAFHLRRENQIKFSHGIIKCQMTQIPLLGENRVLRSSHLCSQLHGEEIRHLTHLCFTSRYLKFWVMACAAPTYFLHSSTVFGVLKSRCRRRHGPVGRINLAMILRENIPSELVFHILYAYIWHEARLSATHILFTLNWTQPTCSWCTSLQWSLGLSSFPHFLHFLHLTWLPLWVNFVTKIVTAAPRELEGMQEYPGQESRLKSRRRRRHPLQVGSLCLSKERWRNLDWSWLILYSEWLSISWSVLSVYWKYLLQSDCKLTNIELLTGK